MKQSEIKTFQKKSRMEQLQCLVADKIRQGYTVDDFQKEYCTSEQDREEFLIIQSEILQK